MPTESVSRIRVRLYSFAIGPLEKATLIQFSIVVVVDKILDIDLADARILGFQRCQAWCQTCLICLTQKHKIRFPR